VLKRKDMMTKTILFFIVGFSVIGASSVQAQEELSKRFESIEDIQHFLAHKDSGGIFDFGHYLKGGGIRELRDLCQSFDREGFRLWIITVPKSMPVHVAERIYGNMNYDENDILIVFKPGRIYGKTLALKGEAEKFREFAEKSRKAFKRYFAYGLKNYAELIKNRIQERRKEVITARARKGAILKATGIILGFGVIGGIVGFIFLVPMRRKKIYRKQVEAASSLLGEISMMDIREGFEDKFLELSGELDQYRTSENYRFTERVEKLMEELKALRKQMEERGE
jgi:hypothetical protein